MTFRDTTSAHESDHVSGQRPESLQSATGRRRVEEFPGVPRGHKWVFDRDSGRRDRGNGHPRGGKRQYVTVGDRAIVHEYVRRDDEFVSSPGLLEVGPVNEYRHVVGNAVAVGQPPHIGRGFEMPPDELLQARVLQCRVGMANEEENLGPPQPDRSPVLSGALPSPPVEREWPDDRLCGLFDRHVHALVAGVTDPEHHPLSLAPLDLGAVACQERHAVE